MTQIVRFQQKLIKSKNKTKTMWTILKQIKGEYFKINELNETDCLKQIASKLIYHFVNNARNTGKSLPLKPTIRE